MQIDRVLLLQVPANIPKKVARPDRIASSAVGLLYGCATSYAFGAATLFACHFGAGSRGLLRSETNRRCPCSLVRRPRADLAVVQAMCCLTLYS